MLSNGMPWNIPRVTCIFSRQVEYLMVYYGKALSHAVKYAMHAQHYRGDIREAHDGKAGLSTVEYTTAILYSNWHGIM